MVILTSGAYFGVTFASKTVTFVATINPGVLTTDIRDEQGNSIAKPIVSFGPIVSSDDCLFAEAALTSLFGRDDARIYVDNPQAVDGGWTLTLAPVHGDEAIWQGKAGNKLDLDDPGSNSLGCEDSDNDGAAGYLTVNPRSARLTPDCQYCSAKNLVLGPSGNASFASSESLTLVHANDTSSGVGRWYITGIEVRQTVPASQADDEYSLDLVLTATAS